MMLLGLAFLLVGVVYSTPTPQGYRYGHGGHHGGGKPVTNVVDLGYSKYQGTTLQGAGVNQFLGIRFAAPPVGDLRWRAPSDPLSTTTLQQATEFAPVCLGSVNTQDLLSEDCLFLNIFTPANATTESKLPVWFFIQGGGYAGDQDQNFNGTEVVKQSGHNMIWMQINYRVGALGFLASEKIRKDGDLNVGLLDQRKALHWAQKYIHLFGGDPSHVVIHGDSAGGGSIAHHLTAYSGRNDNLFVGAIAQSPFWPTQRTVPEMEFQFDIYAKNLSCPPDKSSVMSCLRSKDTATLQSSNVISRFPGGPSAPYPSWYWLPVVDGVFSTDYLTNLFSQGKTVRVPLIVGNDNDEGTYFVPNANTSAQFLSFIDANYPNLEDRTLKRILAAYPRDAFTPFPNHGPWFPATAQAYGEATFVCPGVVMTNSLAQYFSADKVWNYRYNVADLPTIEAGFGVPHVAEKPAIWGPGNAGACDDPCSYETYNAAIVPVVMSYYISFIRALNPNTYKVKQAPVRGNWREKRGRWGGSGALQRLKIQTNASAMEVVPRAQLGRCEVWKQLAEITEQK